MATSSMPAGSSSTVASVGMEPLASKTLVEESAALHVLCVPELVDLIFSFLPRLDNARNAQVCKTWSVIALKIIWERVDDLVALFSILAPMVAFNQQTRPNVYDFVQLPSTTRWRRFELYATLVKTIVYSPAEGPEKRQITRSVLRDVAQTRTQLDIFPSLHTLEWAPAMHDDDMNSSSTPLTSDCFIFMHPGLKTLELYIHKSIPPSRTKHFLGDIAPRAPFLTEVILRTTVNVSGIEDGVRRFVASLPALQKISLPEGYLTSGITETLSTLPLLRQIEVGWEGDPSPDQPAAHFAPVIPPGRFAALENFSGAMVFSDVVKVLDNVAKENGLSSLLVESSSPSSEDLRRILDICSKKHSQLNQLDLLAKQDEDTPLTPLTAQTLHSVKQLPLLTVLNIEHMSPVDLSSAELTSITSALPLLSELWLNPSPVYCETASFGLDVIPVITRNCKALTDLGLFLDATTPLPDINSYSSELAAANLERLYLGASVITKEVCHDVALYLSTRIPPECEICYDDSWVTKLENDVDGPHAERARIAAERIKLWEEVEGLVLFSAKVRRQERGRLGAF